MASQFNQYDWYWQVLDTNPSTHRYSTRTGSFVVVGNADYTAWLAADGGNAPTIIDTFVSLCGVINGFAVSNYVPSTKYLTLTADVTLTNPTPNLIIVSNNIGTPLKVILPVSNAPNSIPVGVPIVFRNVSAGAGAFAVSLLTSDGATSVGGPPVEPGMIITAVPASNSTKIGGWDVRNSGNISASGVPAASQYARWMSQFTIEGVSPSTVRSDIQAYPVSGGPLTGNIIIQKASPALILQRSASGQLAFIDGNTAGSNRWRMALGDATAESAGDVGSDFSLQRFTNGGVAIDFPLTITRSSGAAVFSTNVAVNGNLQVIGTSSIPGYLTTTAAAAAYQPLDADLTALAAISTVNYLPVRTAANTWSNAAYSAGISLAAGVLTLDDDLRAISALSGTDTIYYRSGVGAWSPVTFSGLTFTGGVLTATGGGNVSNSGTPTANDVAQWVTSTTIKGIPLATWRTTPTFYGVTSIRTADLVGGLDISPYAASTLVTPAGTGADLGLSLSSKGNGSLTMYVASFGAICAQFNAAPGTNTFPTFTGNIGYSNLGNNPTTNPIVMTSVMKLLGVTDASAAPAGVVGEVIESKTITLTSTGASNTAANLASITLPAGDWDVYASVTLYCTAAAITRMQASISLTSATNTTDPPIGMRDAMWAAGTPPYPQNFSHSLGPRRVLATASTPVYLVLYQTFSSGTCQQINHIYARRTR